LVLYISYAANKLVWATGDRRQATGSGTAARRRLAFFRPADFSGERIGGEVNVLLLLVLALQTSVTV